MAPKTPDDSKKQVSDSQIIERMSRTGTAMRALLDEQKRARSRRRRAQFAIALVILLVVAYFAMTTFIFNPIEPAAPPFQDAVPSNCHFFVRKVGLSKDFPLPDTVVTPRGEQATLWRAFEEGKLGVPAATVKEWMQQYDDMAKAAASSHIDPLSDFLGREVCIAGRFPEKGGLQGTKYCIYLRVSWKIRAAMGLGKYEYFRRKFAPDLQIDINSDGVWKVGGAGAKELFVYRSGDLVMVSNDDGWIREARNLLIDREGCFGVSSKFAEDIRLKLESHAGGGALPSNIQFYADLDAYRKAAGAAHPFPDPKSADYGERALAGFYSQEFLKDVAGVVRFETTPRRRITLEVTCRTDAEKLDAFGKRIYQDKWNHQLTSQDLRLLAEMTPQAAFAAGAFGLSGGDLSRQAEALLTVEDRRALDSVLRNTGKYDSAKALADDFGTCVGDRIIAIFRENNYPHEEKDPKGDGPDPAMAFILPQRSPEKIRQMQDFFLKNRSQFGVEETYHWDLDGGYKLLEYYSPVVPGTGEIAVLPLGADEKSNVIISNQAKLIRSIHKVFAASNYADDRPMGESGFYRDLMEDQKGKPLNFVFLANGPKLATALKKYIPYWAGVGSMLDPERMKAERPALFAKLLKQKYPQFTPENCPDKEKEEVEGLVDEEMSMMAAQARASVSPQLTQRYEENLQLISAVPGALVAARLELKRVHLFTNVLVE
jgi:hypothetical protein